MENNLELINWDQLFLRFQPKQK